jgi:hypothetical protein
MAAVVVSGMKPLAGQVKCECEPDDAKRVVRRLAGVKGVTTLIAVRPQVKSLLEDLKHKIEVAPVSSAKYGRPSAFRSRYRAPRSACAGRYALGPRSGRPSGSPDLRWELSPSRTNSPSNSNARWPEGERAYNRESFECMPARSQAAFLQGVLETPFMKAGEQDHGPEDIRS